MSQVTRLLLAFALFLGGITIAHGALNLGWLEAEERELLKVGHLPVT